MNVFPTTSYTLVQKLAVEATGGSDAAWVRFYDLYTPAMKRFVQLIDHNHDPDDVVQEVYIHLVKILEERKYKAEKAQFRTFLKMLIRRQLIGMYRHERARGTGEAVSMDELTDEPSVPPEQGAALDLAWDRARHEAAVEHILTKTALSAKTKAVYRAHVWRENPRKRCAESSALTTTISARSSSASRRRSPLSRRSLPTNNQNFFVSGVTDVSHLLIIW